MLPCQAKVDLEVMAMKRYSTFPKASQSDCLVSYPEHSLGELYPSAEMQLVYSTTAADLAIYIYIYIYRREREREK